MTGVRVREKPREIKRHKSSHETMEAMIVKRQAQSRELKQPELKQARTGSPTEPSEGIWPR